MRRLSMAGLALAAGVLAGVIGLEVLATGRVPDGEALPRRTIVPLEVQPTATAARSSLADAATVLARPLFAPGRRPAPAQPAPAVAAAAAIPRLAGILSTPGTRVALFAMPPGRVQAAREGERVEAWTVLAIGVDGVTLGGAGGTVALRTSFSDAPPPVRAPPPDSITMPDGEQIQLPVTGIGLTRP